MISKKYEFSCDIFQEKCCGVDGYGDFTGLSNWPPTTIGGYAVTDLQTPIMCCKTLPDFSGTPNYDCAKTGTATTTNNYLNEVSRSWQ